MLDVVLSVFFIALTVFGMYWVEVGLNLIDADRKMEKFDD